MATTSSGLRKDARKLARRMCASFLETRRVYDRFSDDGRYREQPGGIKAPFPRAPEITRASSRKSGNEARVLSSVLSLLRALLRNNFALFPLELHRRSLLRAIFTSRVHFCLSTFDDFTMIAILENRFVCGFYKFLFSLSKDKTHAFCRLQE